MIRQTENRRQGDFDAAPSLCLSSSVTRTKDKPIKGERDRI